MSNRIAALENLHENVDINRAWESTGKNTHTLTKKSLSYYKLKQHKWFDVECSKLLRLKEAG
jgi:hypothetical protein